MRVKIRIVEIISLGAPVKCHELLIKLKLSNRISRIPTILHRVLNKSLLELIFSPFSNIIFSNLKLFVFKTTVSAIAFAAYFQPDVDVSIFNLNKKIYRPSIICFLYGERRFSGISSSSPISH